MSDNLLPHAGDLCPECGREIDIDKSDGSAFCPSVGAHAARFTHDCPECIYLGQHEEYDLYVCTSGDPIARYGNEGWEYRCMMSGTLTPEMLDNHPFYAEIVKRATALGITVEVAQ